MGIRGEYTQLLQKRSGIGSFVPSGVGFNTLPGIVGKGAYLSATYLLTGEKEPENAIPRVKHPVIGPNSPGESGGPGWGAFALKARYSWLQGRAGGIHAMPPPFPPARLRQAWSRFSATTPTNGPSASTGISTIGSS